MAQQQTSERIVSGGSFDPRWRGAWCQHEAKTIVELFQTQVENLGEHTLFLFKQKGVYTPISWLDFRDEIHALAAGLVDLGIEVGERVVLLSENRLEWVLVDQAILHAGAITVSIHAPLTAVQVQEQIADSGAVAAFVSNQTQFTKVQAVRDRLPDLKHLISLEPIPGVLSYRQLQERGRQLLRDKPNLLRERWDPMNWDSIAALLYTSGTTGEGKGVMLSHGNLLSNMYAILPFFPAEDKENVVLNFLPLSHIYARTCDYLCVLGMGVVMAFAESIETLPQDLQRVKPHLINGVPRFYEKVRDRILQTLEEKTLLRLLGKFAYRLAVRRAFGGRLRYASAGGATLDPQVAEFYLEHGLEVFQGYGLTEASPVIACNRPGAHKIGTVGPPIPGVEVKIGEDGEILARGPNVMKGYWKKPEATAESISPDGWLHTGDTGYLDESGFLTITDRKKDIIVLAGGKNIAPVAIETALVRNPYIEQVVVYGDKKKFVSALIVPDMMNLKEWARTKGLHFHSSTELVQLPEVYAFIEEQVNDSLKNFAHYERVRKFILLPETFSVESGDVTITLKMRRARIIERYREQLDALYEEK